MWMWGLTVGRINNSTLLFSDLPCWTHTHTHTSAAKNNSILGVRVLIASVIYECVQTCCVRSSEWSGTLVHVMTGCVRPCWSGHRLTLDVGFGRSGAVVFEVIQDGRVARETQQHLGTHTHIHLDKLEIGVTEIGFNLQFTDAQLLWYCDCIQWRPWLMHFFFYFPGSGDDLELQFFLLSKNSIMQPTWS